METETTANNSASCITIADILRARKILDAAPVPPLPPVIRISPYAVKPVEPNIKPSRSRKPRVLKKLLRRLEKRHEPAVIEVYDPITGRQIILMHPVVHARLVAQTTQRITETLPGLLIMDDFE